MRYPLIEPRVVVAQCTCTHEDRFDGRTVKHFRFFPYPPKTCPAHPTPEGWFR